MIQEDRFEKRLTQATPGVLSKIAQIDELKGYWNAGVHLSPQTLNSLKRSVLITSTGASTRIEGAKLSDEEVGNALKGLTIEKFENRDVQEVKGYFEVLEQIFNSWKDIKLNEGSIKHFHKELLKYAEKDRLHLGEYKSKDNQVRMIGPKGENLGIVFDTTPAYLTPIKMRELVEWTNGNLFRREYHPLLVIGNFLVEFLMIHPFEDGNGRLSRILTNLLLLQAGYAYIPYVSHEKLIEDRKVDYYLALRDSQKTFKSNNDNIISWLSFFLEIIAAQSRVAIDLLGNSDIEKVLSPKQLAVWRYLQGSEETSRADIVKATDITAITVNQALTKLLALKKIERLGTGPGTRYKVIG